MSLGVGNGMRVLRGCRALLAPSRSAAASASATNTTTTTKSKTSPKPKGSSDAGNPTKSARTAAASKPKVKREYTRPVGILKEIQLSPALGSFLGVPEASRPQVMKEIWSYVKLHNLQNPANKREINCDEKLKTIFNGREKVGMLEVGKLLAPHFVKNA